MHSCANNDNGQPHRPNSLKDFMEEAKSLGRVNIRTMQIIFMLDVFIVYKNRYFRYP